MKFYIKYYSDNGLDTLREIEESEYNYLIKIREKVHFYKSLEDSLEIIKLNILDYRYLIFEYSEKHRLRFLKTTDDHSIPLLFFNQRLANILTSFKSYQDHVSKYLNIIFEDAGKSKEFFLSQTKIIYDKYFAYRFFAKLRDYVQHKGFPITNINYNSKVVEKGIKQTISVQMRKSDLLEAKVWKAMKSEIIDLDDMIDPKNYLNEFLHSLYKLHESMWDFLNDDFSEVSKILNDIKQQCLKKFYNENNDFNKFEDIIRIVKKDEQNNIEDFWLPTYVFHKVKVMRANNHFPEDFIESYVDLT